MLFRKNNQKHLFSIQDIIVNKNNSRQALVPMSYKINLVETSQLAQPDINLKMIQNL